LIRALCRDGDPGDETAAADWYYHHVEIRHRFEHLEPASALAGDHQRSS